MRSIIVFLILFPLSISAQDISAISLDSIKAYVERDSIKKDSIKKEFLTNNWSNTEFNPYRNTAIEFPFELNFDDVYYASPISKDYVITSRFGWRWSRVHKGIDIDLITGDNVIAMLDGKVRYVGYHSGHGKTIVVRHYNGLETVYAHLSGYKVKVNETVRKGQIIGTGGNTGNSRGSHVHIESTYKGLHINPEYIFSFDSSNKIKKPTFWITRDWVTPFLHNSNRQSEFVYFNSKEEAKQSKGIKQEVYIVKKGDTLYDISRRFNVSVSKICKANAIGKNTVLKIGQELVF